MLIFASSKSKRGTKQQPHQYEGCLFCALCKENHSGNRVR